MSIPRLSTYSSRPSACQAVILWGLGLDLGAPLLHTPYFVVTFSWVNQISRHGQCHGSIQYLCERLECRVLDSRSGELLYSLGPEGAMRGTITMASEDTVRTVVRPIEQKKCHCELSNAVAYISMQMDLFHVQDREMPSFGFLSLWVARWPNAHTQEALAPRNREHSNRVIGSGLVMLPVTKSLWPYRLLPYPLTLHGKRYNRRYHTSFP
ncbi:hypothetical protein EDB85DRAFT_1984939 [Lactarius pseudohatsudake]|nr:hypothetical protein EDB85DRAFT_1984939 [Lactarius pseudohatsudake]